MALAFDTSRAPLRPEEFVDLVRAVVGAGPGDEGHWIEWKSSLDLGSAEGKAAVVRCVLGLANRQPDAAARFCEGRGYVVVGAEPGRLAGVPEADPADLTNWWTPYLGADGPRWVPHWVPVDGKTVLVVEVAAPRLGDPLFTARKSTTGLADGEVFVRRAGQTERASSGEIAALVRRASSAQELTGVSVDLLSGPVRPVTFGADDIDSWIAAARAECLESLRNAQALPDPQPPRRRATGSGDLKGLTLSELKALEQREADGDALTPAEQASLETARQAMRDTMRTASEALGAMWSTEPEERSAEAYEQEVESHLRALAAALPGQLRAAATRLVPPCRLALRNDTAKNLPDVRLVLHVPGDARAGEPDDDGPGLPSPPRPYGPRRVNRISLGGLPFDSSYLLPRSYAPPALPGFDIEEGGSVTIRFDPVHLRPRDTVPLPPVALILSGPCTASWEITSTGADGVCRGTVRLPVQGAPLTVEEALAPDGPD